MKKLALEPLARFKLERLCDAQHPEEVGGKLLGISEDNTTIVKDVFGIPNVAENRRSHYQEYSPAQYFLPLYERMVNLRSFGNFHSHPNGTIPSEGDMRACPGLNLWVIHHQKGEHTFTASYDYKHMEVLLLNEQQERRVSEFRGNRFFLGDVEIDRFGRLMADATSMELLKLPEKTRIAYQAFLQVKDRWHEVETKVLAKALNWGHPTVRKWLKKANKLVKLTRYGVRQR